MCETCGCGDPEMVPVEVQEKILSGNERQAAHNRAHFGEHGVLAINLMGSPGAGKTAVLEATARALSGRRLAAMAGDLATERDAERLRAAGIPTQSITTGSACHLDADLVHRALHHIALDGIDYLFIENVGNLVCPAVYDLGQAFNVVALAVTEGEDKPLKYPVMFRKADLVLVTKVDLLPHLPDVRVEAIEENLARVMPALAVLPVSARTGQGIDTWTAWLERERPRQHPSGVAAHHQHG
ncbi:MAG: hydrogenase accessory protein HypB [Acidobacteria bacterium]|nr:hydrogenase accessory protein HypB [Acidobacteriota bacterium]